jgi:hypothetical protein
MRSLTPSKVPPGFTRVLIGRYHLILRDELTAATPRLLAALAEIQHSGTGRGNRRGGFRLPLDGHPELFVRFARRGGLMRFVTRDLYFGQHPRPFQELAVAIEAGRRGIPATTPMGAIVETAVCGLYRGAFLTRALDGRTLWEYLQSKPAADDRTRVFTLVREGLAAMHRGGLQHADLNLHNFFVCESAAGPSVTLLDLDKARLFPGRLPQRLQRGHLKRLLRSARKLDPDGRFLDSSAILELFAE